MGDNLDTESGVSCSSTTPEHKRAFGRLVDKLTRFSLDELLAAEWWVDRVNTVGADQYGRYNAAADTRNFRKEGSEELLDLLTYLGFDFVKRELAKRRARIASFIADEVRPGEVEDREVAARERRECEVADRVCAAASEIEEDRGV